MFGEADDNARLVAEMFAVHHETGLTPRQLAEQRAELLEALCELVNAYEPDDLSEDCPHLQKARAAIARARGEG